MGIRSALAIRQNASQLASAFAAARISTLDSVQWPEAPNPGPIDRAQALQVPAVLQGLQTYAVLATLPLVYWTAGETTSTAPAGITQPDPELPSSRTYGETITDLILSGSAWWVVLAEAGTADRSVARPTAFRQVSFERVWADPDDDRQVRIDDELYQVVTPLTPLTPGRRSVIRFDGPVAGGILTAGAPAIRTALMLERAALKFAGMEIPAGYLKNTSGADLTEDQINEMLDHWETARAQRATAYVNGATDFHTTTFDPTQLQLVEARHASDARIAQLMNLPPHTVNAPSSSSSLDYTNLESRRRDLTELAFAPIMSAITDRLSMSDVTPVGHRVTYDLRAFYRADLGALVAAGVQAVGAGLISVNEWRTLAGLPASA